MYDLDWSRLRTLNTCEMLEEVAKRRFDKRLFLFEDQTVTYGEHNEWSNRAANGLLQLGINKGDAVCLWMPNCPEWLYIHHGMRKAGIVVVPLMPGLSGPYLAHMINDSDAETIVMDVSCMPAFHEIAGQLKNIKNIIIDTHGSPIENAGGPAHAIALEQLFDAPSDPPPIDVRFPDLGWLLYTSGTTGLPKALVWRHFSGLEQPPKPGPSQNFGVEPGQVYYMYYPFLTAFGLVLICYSMGVVLAFGRNTRIDTFWDDIRRYDAVGFHYFADLIPALLSQPERADDSDNPARFCRGIMAPRDPKTIAEFENRFDVRVIETFGSVEGGSVTVNLDRVAGSTGKADQGVIVKIVDDDGNEVGPGVVGEIVHKRASGQPMIVEYYKNPEASAAKTRDGWFHSDDLGYKDEDGNIYFVDRKLDVIRKDGKDIYASAIEEVAARHPAVAECTAVGAPCGVENDDIRLCVVCREGETVEPEEIYRFCEERLDEHMLPRYVEFRDSLPRGFREKVQRYKLRAEGIAEDIWDRLSSEPKG